MYLLAGIAGFARSNLLHTSVRDAFIANRVKQSSIRGIQSA